MGQESVDDRKEQLLEAYGKLLEHKVRRQMIRMLGSRKVVRFIEFRDELGLEVGTLYHHLEVMKDFISQDPDKRYILSSLGQEAYDLLLTDEERLIIVSPEARRKTSRATSLLLAEPLFKEISSSPGKHVVEAVVVMTLYSWLCISANIEPLFLFYDHSTVPSLPIIVIEVALSWLTVWILTEIITKKFYNRNPWDKGFFISIPFIFLTLALYPISIHLLRQLNLSPLTLRKLSAIIILLSQVWTIGLLAKAININKKLRFESSLLSALITTNICIVIAYILLSL